MINEQAPVYIAEPSEAFFFDKPKLGIGFVPNGACTNECIFCEPNIPAMEKQNPETPHRAPRKYTVTEYTSRVMELLDRRPEIDEIVITGIIGEPLLFLDNLTELLASLKKRSALPIRLNTNGQASVITNQKSEEVAQRLKQAGLDKVAISVNAVSENDYNQLCRPKLQGAYDSVIEFIRASKAAGLNIALSFVDYSKYRQDWPAIKKEEVYRFAEQFGLTKDDVIFRPYITDEKPITKN
jgi:TatD family-associated radical SAM protein